MGRFPPGWSEWNGRYRDTMRDFWRRQGGLVGEFATRFSGSSDLYGGSRRRPTASVNLICVHDGFTLRDLVSYDAKHNEANGEANRDGTDDNRSWNCGVEGPSDDPEVVELRARQSRALLTTLLLSFGVPLLCGGDELGRTQGGNNNAYCQDNSISWFDWSQPDDELLAFTRRLVALRREHPVLRRRRFLVGMEASELAWFTPSAKPMATENWTDPNARALAIYLDGDDAPTWPRTARPARRRLPRPHQRLVGAAPVPGARGRRGTGLAHRTGHLRPRASGGPAGPARRRRPHARSAVHRGAP